MICDVFYPFSLARYPCISLTCHPSSNTIGKYTYTRRFDSPARTLPYFLYSPRKHFLIKIRASVAQWPIRRLRNKCMSIEPDPGKKILFLFRGVYPAQYLSPPSKTPWHKLLQRERWKRFARIKTCKHHNSFYKK